MPIDRTTKIRLLPDEIFTSNRLKENLARKTVRGGLTTVTAQGVKFILNIARTMILARLLFPEDFGLISMVTAIIGLASMFKDAGLSMATVQQKRITPEQISSLFWINAAISAVLGICIVLAAPLIASFYGRPELAAVTAALAISFIISGLTIQHAALLNRHMRFAALAVEQICATCVGLLTAVIMASTGLRYWALVGETIASAVVVLTLTFFFCPWLPGKYKRGSGARDMLKFGGYLTGFNFLNYLSRNMDNVLIGKFLGAAQLGFYDKAYHLFRMPMGQIRAPLSTVAMPALSSLQNDPERFRRYYQHLLDILATVTMPLTIYCALEADFIIPLVLGRQWLAAIPVFRILAIAGFIDAVVGTRGLVMTSCGLSKRYFHWGVVVSLSTLAGFVAGIPFGIIGVATAYVVVRLLMLFPSLFYCFNKTPVKVSDFFQPLYQPFLCSALSGTILLLMLKSLSYEGTAIHFLYAFIFAGIYAGLTWTRRSFRQTASLLLEHLPGFKGSKKANQQ